MKTLKTIEAEFDKQFPIPSLPVTSLEHVKTVKIQQDALDEYYRLLNPAVKTFLRQAFTELLEGLKLKKKDFLLVSSTQAKYAMKGYNQAVADLESLKQQILK